MSNLPPMPDKSYLGDDVSWGYDAYDMRDYAEEAVRLERERCIAAIKDVPIDHAFVNTIEACAAAIRARSQEGDGAIK